MTTKFIYFFKPRDRYLMITSGELWVHGHLKSLTYLWFSLRSSLRRVVMERCVGHGTFRKMSNPSPVSNGSGSSRGYVRGQGNQRRGWWRGRGNNYRGWRGNNYNNNRRGGRGNFGNATPSSSGASSLMESQPRQIRPEKVQTVLHVASPYAGWSIYFPDQVYSDHAPVVEKVQVFEKFFVSWSKLYDWDEIEQKSFFTVDYKELSSDKVIKDNYIDLESELRDLPEKVLACIGLAMHQIVSHSHQQEAVAVVEELGGSRESIASYCAPFIQPRIINFGTPLPLKSFRANCYGKFVSVKGTVVRVGNIKPLCTKMAFRCANCTYVQAITLPDGKYTVPTKCPADECRGRTFQSCRSDKLTETIDWQTIRVQEIMPDSQKEAGRIPRTIDCELTRDLVDSCVPGDVVTVSGIVKVNSVDESRGKNKDKCMFLLYLHGNSVNNSKGNKRKLGDGGEGSGLAMDFTMKELYAIQEIQSQENLFQLLVSSLCPSIFGHEMVKAALILCLFGSGQKFTNDKNRIPIRGDPHILVVGDPGLGKSQMLQAAASVAPRSVYVCGNTTTTSGLTVTLCKEGGTGDFALEAGALVLADQGCCCIDEFDKMGSQHQALLEAMEQQSISIAKAGIVCSLPARTSILAAANPVGGHYNKAKTVSENLKMGSALLSRFDLVFIMLDKPDEEMDCVLSEHVMALHAGTKRATLPVRNALSESRISWELEKSLSERLKSARSEETDNIPHQLLRKYVGYARKYVHPKIGPEAAAVIQEFYLKLRRQHQSRDSTPITTRQLESLIRLTEARARLELRELATKADAEDVVEIMKHSMQDVYSDQFGFIDFQRSQHGSGMSGRSQPKKFVSALQRVAEQTYNNIFTVQQMRQLSKDIGMNIPDFEGFVLSLNNQGFLLKKGPKVYQLQTFGY
ncbi:DNA helicase MCM8-like [Physella acuta]|uniref:DNA helicase MCM8-like n=1 Tax=Physella acuta TaxID=109671 RepID=UPI0027DC0732|nr:DNA helicase MCM8-like [Physella acuta]